jgi:hypothetical protein
MNDKKLLQTPAIILGISLILCVIIFGNFLYRIQSLNNTLTVTGSARQKVVSDTGKLVGRFTRTVTINDLKNGYKLMDGDRVKVTNFFVTQGINEKDMIISAVSQNEIWKQNEYDDRPKQYNLVQTIEINSNDVNQLDKLSKNFQPIINQDVLFAIDRVEYFYSKLPESRISLLSDAIKDAKARAEKIAASSGKRVGVIKSASAGVVQVLSPNSIDVSDYGTYDTSSINKEIMVTVKALFTIR